jgi:N-acyl-D-amino-acid deacylase
VRGATVVDGLGRDARRADVAVEDGRIAAIGELREEARETVDAGGLTLAPGIVDLHTHYDAQATWDATLSPSPSLGVTTAVMGNCGFGIVPSPPEVRDLILRNLSVVEGMDLDSLRAGVDWRFEKFVEYMGALRRIAPYLNVAVLAGHSVIRTAVMGEEASTRATPSAEQMARMKAMVADAMANGAIGFGSSYSPNHSGFEGVPMPSTVSALDELDALVGAMGPRGSGVVQLASGRTTVEDLEQISARHGRRIFMSAAVAMYNEQEPTRSRDVFAACHAAHARGNGVYVQIPCQPLSFDFTLANAYPFHGHPTFWEVKALPPAKLKPVLRDASFRERFRQDLKAPLPGLIFQGNWNRVVVAVAAKPANQRLVNRDIAEIAREAGRDPVDVIFDLALEEDLETAFLGKFLNVVEDGVGPLLKDEAGVVALSDAGAHLVYMCDAGFGLHFLARWVRERGLFDLVEGVRRLTSHQADLYGIEGRGRIEVGAHADLLLFDPATVGVSPARRVADLPGGGRRTVRDPKGVHGVFVNGVRVFDGENYVRHEKGPGRVLDRFQRVEGPLPR